MRRDHLIGYLLIIPAFLAIFAVIIYPMITAFDMSLHKIILTQPKLGRPFIGLENYRAVMTGPVFMNAVKNTVVWTGVNLVVQMVLGTLIALLLSENFPGRALARGAMLIPGLLPRWSPCFPGAGCMMHNLELSTIYWLNSALLKRGLPGWETPTPLWGPCCWRASGRAHPL